MIVECSASVLGTHLKLRNNLMGFTFTNEIGNGGGCNHNFPSAATATHFFQSLANGKHVNAKVISIGPATSKAIRALGQKVDREARVSTIEGLVEAVVDEEHHGISKV